MRPRKKAYHKGLLHYLKVDKGQDIFTATADFQIGQVHELRGRALSAQTRPTRPRASSSKANALATSLLTCSIRCSGADNDYVLEVRAQAGLVAFSAWRARSGPQGSRRNAGSFTKNHSKDDLDCGRYHHLLLEIEDRAGNIQQADRRSQAHRRLVADGLVACAWPC